MRIGLATGLLTIALATMSASVMTQSSGVPTKGDWPQILGPNRNGIYSGPEIAASFPRSGPPSLWTRDVGAGFAGPAVPAIA